jgi:hypothetical protein
MEIIENVKKAKVFCPESFPEGNPSAETWDEFNIYSIRNNSLNRVSPSSDLNERDG